MKYTEKKNVHQVGSIYKIIQRCMVNRTLKKSAVSSFAAV